MSTLSSCLGRWAINALVALLAVIRAHSAPHETTVIKTNYADRFVTNRIEITVPRNITVDVFQTNRVNIFQTNTVSILNTNVVPVYQTNYAQAWLTNTRTIWLTNISTVVALKTNVVNQTVTNVVQIDLTAPEHIAPQKQTAADGQLIIQVVASSKKTGTKLVSVRLKASTGQKPCSVESWKVQSLDGAVMSFGQQSEFNKDLPVGRYNVETTAHGQDSKQLKCKAVLVVDESAAFIVGAPLAAK